VQVEASTGGYGSYDVAAELHPAPDGTWRGDFRIPPGYVGTFKVELVEIWDRAGWWREYEEGELASRGMSPTFRVSGPADRTSPRVASLRLGARTADARERDEQIPVRVRVVDDVAVAGVQFRATHAASGRDPVKVVMALRSGGLRNGVWSGKLRLRPGVRPGPWNLQVAVADNADHRDIVKASELTALGLPSTLTVHSVRDARPPEIELVSMSPERVDTRTGDSSVLVRVRVTDGGTGVEQVQARLAFPDRDDDGWRIYQDLARAPMTRVKGSIWEADLPVTRCEPRYRAEQQAVYPVHLLVDAKDGVRNKRTLKPPPVMQLTTSDTIRPLSYAADSPVPASGPITVFFGEPLVGVTALAIRPHGWLPHYGDPPTIPVTWTCAGAERAPVSCSEGPVHSATLTPATPLKSKSHYVVVPNPEHVLSALDPAGNPALGASFSTQ
jgi:hypothetical protein